MESPKTSGRDLLFTGVLRFQMNEIWKKIPESLSYEVSNLGRVRSLDREVCTGPGRWTYIKKGKVLKPYVCGNNKYFTVDIGCGKDRKTKSVHSLVASAFLGDKPKGFDTDHKNGDKYDNRAENLEYVTHRENVRRGRRCAMNNSKSSKFVGVSFLKKTGKWRAYVNKNGRQYNAGHHSTEIEAKEASDKKLMEIGG